MPLHQVIVLAVVQGITEFLPISSSAHLALSPWLFGWKDQGLSFDIALHFGTLAAVIIYFFRDWLQLVAQAFGMRYAPDTQLSQNPRLLWLLAIASVPVGIFGYLFQDHAENSWRHNHLLIGCMLIGVALLMAIVERVSRGRKDVGEVSLADSMVIGLAQAVAIIPGVSRSGITITAGLLRDIDRAAAARFSFLLSTPAIAAAAAKDCYDLVKTGGIEPGMHLPFFLGISLSAVTGCLVIAFLLKYLRNHSLSLFIYYRVVFGIIVIALAFFRAPAG